MKEQQTGNDLSIALRYDGVGAPRVTAKGEGDLAREILELAKKHGIPYQENPVLVQLLAQIELGDQIPRELYVAVAEVISFAYIISGKRPPLETGTTSPDE